MDDFDRPNNSAQEYVWCIEIRISNFTPIFQNIVDRKRPSNLFAGMLSAAVVLLNIKKINTVDINVRMHHYPFGREIGLFQSNSFFTKKKLFSELFNLGYFCPAAYANEA